VATGQIEQSMLARIVFNVISPLLKRFLTVIFGLLSLSPLASGSPATAPSTAPSTKPAATRLIAKGATTGPTSKAQDERATKRKLLELTRKSIDLLQNKQYAQAETVLAEALSIDPAEPTNLYNMACLLALTKRANAAVDFLERSAEAGFTDFLHIAKDSDLDSLHADPRFLAFMAKKDHYQRVAAQAVMDTLKKQFGDDYIYELDEADKLVFASATDQPTLDALRQGLVRQAHSQWDQLFEHKPDQYIAVVVPTPRDHRRLMPMPGVEGYYRHDARMLIVKGLGFVTTHEFTHALHAADLDPLGQEHPIWLVEGLAVLFEHVEYVTGSDGKEVLTPLDNARLKHLQAMGRQNRLMPLEKLLKMEQRELLSEQETAMMGYAEAGSVMHYLYDQKLLRKFYETFKAEYDKDNTGKAALEKTLGKPLAQIEKDWKEWMLKRLAPAMEPKDDMPSLGMRFGSANDGMLVQTVVRGGPAMRAGVRVGDVIIAVDDIDTRDELAFTPVIAQHKAGDIVTFRLRRNHNYLEMRMVLGNRNDPRTGGAVPGTLTIKPSNGGKVVRPPSTEPSTRPAGAPAR
jgi:tetratricopeptide (TPR) repeat protein